MAAAAVLIRVICVKEWQQPLALHILVNCRVARAILSINMIGLCDIMKAGEGLC